MKKSKASSVQPRKAAMTALRCFVVRLFNSCRMPVAAMVPLLGILVERRRPASNAAPVGGDATSGLSLYTHRWKSPGEANLATRLGHLDAGSLAQEED